MHPRWLYRCLLAVFLAASSVAQQSVASSAAPQELPPTTDAKEIVRRAIESDQHNFQLARNYTCEQREVEKELDKNGNVKSQKSKIYDVGVYYDEVYSRLIQVNDKPLSDKEEKKEQEKLDKLTAKRKNESEGERRKRLEKMEKERQEGRAFVHDLLNAYDFTLTGEELVNGRTAYVIDAKPRRDFHPTQPHADILSKLQGKMWIDKQDYGWIKTHVDVIDTISFGIFLARVHKGTQIEFEQTRLNNEIWLPSRMYLDGNARIALLKNYTFQQEDTFSKYRKFTTSTKILPGVAEVEGPK